MKKRKVTLTVAKWQDDLVCPKCNREVADDENAYDPFQLIHLEDAPLLMVICRTCGFNWLMETADAE